METPEQENSQCLFLTYTGLLPKDNIIRHFRTQANSSQVKMEVNIAHNNDDPIRPLTFVVIRTRSFNYRWLTINTSEPDIRTLTDNMNNKPIHPRCAKNRETYKDAINILLSSDKNCIMVTDINSYGIGAVNIRDTKSSKIALVTRALEFSKRGDGSQRLIVRIAIAILSFVLVTKGLLFKKR